MRTVGQILKRTRLDKGVDLIQIAKTTKIQIKYLEAIEKDAYTTLPSPATSRGFIRNYASAIGLSPDVLLALFRRDFTEDKSGQIIPRGVIKPASEPTLYWTPRHTIAASIMAILIGLSLFFYREYSTLFAPPRLKVNFPKPNAEVKGREITIKGMSSPESEVFVNNEKITPSPNGSFIYTLTSPPGEITFTVTAKNSKGKTSSVTRTIQVIP